MYELDSSSPIPSDPSFLAAEARKKLLICSSLLWRKALTAILSFSQVGFIIRCLNYPDGLVSVKECGKAVRNVKEGNVRYRHVLK